MDCNRFVTRLVFAAAALLVAGTASAQRFSLDGGPGPGAPPLISPSIFMPPIPPPTVDDTDILGPGPLGGPPVVFATGVSLGFPAPGYPSPADELDAITYGGIVTAPTAIHFSTDWLSVGVLGVAPNVFAEAGLAQAPGDIFTYTALPPPGNNTLAINQDALGLIPAIPAGAPFPGYYNDEIDGLDLATVTPPVGFPYFSVGAANTFGVSGADVLAPGPVIAVGFVVLGLVATDDIDALHFDTGTGDIIFSLAPGSPSLAMGASPACAGAACSPADVFLAPGGTGPFVVYLPAPTLGLLATDDIDALAFPQPDPPNNTVDAFSTPGMSLLLMALIGATGLFLLLNRTGWARVG